MGAKHSLGSPELSFRRPNSRDHLHSQHRGSSPHKPCSPSARATFSSQAHEFLPEGSQKLWVRLLPSPEKHGLANLFCSVTLWHTHTPEEAHMLLLPGFHHRQDKLWISVFKKGTCWCFHSGLKRTIKYQETNTAVFPKLPGMVLTIPCGSSAGIHRKFTPATEDWCQRARTMTTEPRAEEQQPLNCTYFTSDSKYKQALKMPFFCLHLPLCCCAVALWTQPCGTTSY